jgi:hypothetical protein
VVIAGLNFPEPHANFAVNLQRWIGCDEIWTALGVAIYKVKRDALMSQMFELFLRPTAIFNAVNSDGTGV